MQKFNLRHATLEDTMELRTLYLETILYVNSKDYNAQQISAWASTADNIEGLQKRILEQYFIVATIDNIIVGFSSIEETGYLDLLYVHKDFQHWGIATSMLHHMLHKAFEAGIRQVCVDSSITSRPFFEHKGFVAQMEQKVQIKGIELTNYHMLLSF